MPGGHIILFFVFTDWSVWSVHSGRNTVFLVLSWRALARHLRSVWIRVLVIWNPMTKTQSLRLLFGQGACKRCPWGEICVHCEFFSMKKLRSRLSLFSRKERQPSASCFSAEARRRMKSWGSQLDMADELERDRPGPENLKEVFQTRRPNDTFVQTRVFHLLISLLFLSNSPATTVNSTWPRLGGNFLLRD